MSWNNQIHHKEKMLNQPVRLHWAGWTSDTYTLQRMGWQISVNQAVHEATLQIAIKHPELRMYGVSSCISYNYLQNMEDGFLSEIELPIQCMTSDLRVVIPLNPMSFNPVDAEPCFTTSMGEKSIDDFKIFKEIKTKEILIEPANVDDMLKEILKMQSPKQKQIRNRMLLENKKEQIKTVHAQILSIAS